MFRVAAICVCGLKPGVKTPASGIGDDALYIVRPPGTSLSVKEESSVFRITLSGFPPDQGKSMEKILALDALSKL